MPDHKSRKNCHLIHTTILAPGQGFVQRVESSSIYRVSISSVRKIAIDHNHPSTLPSESDLVGTPMLHVIKIASNVKLGSKFYGRRSEFISTGTVDESDRHNQHVIPCLPQKCKVDWRVIKR
mmetsp:Transcript_17956/g.37233  ORF Transcript_17956/g.37233 Transcript_17956/m.37233 type:complete len:122 (-) Transcript_17956:1375-1740(-)